MKHNILNMLIMAAIELAAAQTVVVNEIAWMGTEASYSDEWIELYNLTRDSIDLSNWRLCAADGAPGITLQGVIAGHGYFVLERSDDQTISDYLAQQIYTGNMSNEGEHFILTDSAGVIMDQVDCSQGWFAGQNSPEKYTLEKKHPWAPSSMVSSWGQNNGVIRNGHDAAGNPINGTPGAQNSLCTSTGARVGDAPPLDTYRLVNFPNPFKEHTFFHLERIAQPCHDLSLSIYDLLGRKIKTLNAPISSTSGGHCYLWDGFNQNGRNVPPGIYFCRVILGSQTLGTDTLIKIP